MRARMLGDCLTRFAQITDAMPGGFSRSHAVMSQIASPIDEWIAMTAPKNMAQRHVRLMAALSWEIELLANAQSVPDDLPSDDASLWRLFEAAQSLAADACASYDSLDELSVYARRMIGEGAVLAQRLIVRQPEFRMILVGQPDDDLGLSGAFMAELLDKVAAHLRRVGVVI